MVRTLCLCIASCLALPTAAAESPSCERFLTPALQQLVDWPDGDAWRYAVAEHAASGRFVQFGYDKGLFLDLPVQVLSDGEQQAVLSLFAATGGGGPLRVEATDPAGEQTWVDTLHRHFGADGDAATAARLGCRVLAEVLAVPADAELEIEVDGD